jgi:hypothetical protein
MFLTGRRPELVAFDVEDLGCRRRPPDRTAGTIGGDQEPTRQEPSSHYD